MSVSVQPIFWRSFSACAAGPGTSTRKVTSGLAAWSFAIWALTSVTPRLTDSAATSLRPKRPRSFSKAVRNDLPYSSSW